MQALPTLQPAAIKLPLAGEENIPELSREVRELAAERNAVILAHNYQVPEVQQVADYVGDSLGLSQKAAAAGADTIAFCGVHFMAETASILSPDKSVLLPDRTRAVRWPTRSRPTSCASGRPRIPVLSSSCTSTRRPRSRPRPTTA